MSSLSPIDVIVETLAADRAGLRAAVDAVPVAMRMTRPAPDRWSVAGVLEHVSIVERGALKRVRALVESAPPLGDAPGMPTPIDRAMTRNRSRRISAPDPIQPTGTISCEESWSALGVSRAELLHVLESARGRDLARTSQDHPALGALDGYQWIALIGAHEERHALQIAEIHAAVADLAAH